MLEDNIVDEDERRELFEILSSLSGGIPLKEAVANFTATLPFCIPAPSIVFTGSAFVRRLDVMYVFYDRSNGKPYKDIKKSFKSACKKAGIPDFHPHDMRHTFASQLIMQGIDIVTVKELLGHKTLAMTLRYSHLAPAHKARAVELLSETSQKFSAQLVRNA